MKFRRSLSTTLTALLTVGTFLAVGAPAAHAATSLVECTGAPSDIALIQSSLDGAADTVEISGVCNLTASAPDLGSATSSSHAALVVSDPGTKIVGVPSMLGEKPTLLGNGLNTAIFVGPGADNVQISGLSFVNNARGVVAVANDGLVVGRADFDMNPDGELNANSFVMPPTATEAILAVGTATDADGANPFQVSHGAASESPAVAGYGTVAGNLTNFHAEGNSITYVGAPLGGIVGDPVGIDVRQAGSGGEVDGVDINLNAVGFTSIALVSYNQSGVKVHAHSGDPNFHIRNVSIRGNNIGRVDDADVFPGGRVGVAINRVTDFDVVGNGIRSGAVNTAGPNMGGGIAVSDSQNGEIRGNAVIHVADPANEGDLGAIAVFNNLGQLFNPDSSRPDDVDSANISITENIIGTVNEDAPVFSSRGITVTDTDNATVADNIIKFVTADPIRLGTEITQTPLTGDQPHTEGGTVSNSFVCNNQVGTETVGDLRTATSDDVTVGEVATTQYPGGSTNGNFECDPGIGLSVDSISTSEAGDNASVDVRLLAPATGPVTVTISSSAPAQVSAVPAILNFTAANWMTPQTVDIDAVNDIFSEGALDYTFTFAASGANYAGVTNTLTATVIDDELLTYDCSDSLLDDDVASIQSLVDSAADNTRIELSGLCNFALVPPHGGDEFSIAHSAVVVPPGTDGVTIAGDATILGTGLQAAFTILPGADNVTVSQLDFVQIARAVVAINTKGTTVGDPNSSTAQRPSDNGISVTNLVGSDYPVHGISNKTHPGTIGYGTVLNQFLGPDTTMSFNPTQGISAGVLLNDFAVRGNNITLFPNPSLWSAAAVNVTEKDLGVVEGVDIRHNTIQVPQIQLPVFNTHAIRVRSNSNPDSGDDIPAVRSRYWIRDINIQENWLGQDPTDVTAGSIPVYLFGVFNFDVYDNGIVGWGQPQSLAAFNAGILATESASGRIHLNRIRSYPGLLPITDLGAIAVIDDFGTLVALSPRAQKTSDIRIDKNIFGYGSGDSTLRNRRAIVTNGANNVTFVQNDIPFALDTPIEINMPIDGFDGSGPSTLEGATTNSTFCDNTYEGAPVTDAEINFNPVAGSVGNMFPGGLSEANQGSCTPAVIISAPNPDISEETPGVGANVGMRLATRPTASATVTPVAGPQVTTYGVISPFTPSNWWDPQGFEVRAVDDNIDEADIHPGTVTFNVSGYTSSGADPLTVNITDNDDSGLSVDPSTITLDEATPGTDTFEVTLTSAPTDAVVISAAPSESGQVTVSPPSIARDGTNWQTPAVFTVTAINDGVPEVNGHTVDIDLTVTSTDTNYDGAQVAGPTVSLLDSSPRAIVVNPTTVGASEGGASVAYDVSLSAPPSTTATVTLAGTQVSTDLSSLEFTSANYDTPQEVLVTAIDDSVSEGNHVGGVLHTVSAPGDSSYASTPAASLIVNINDNDVADLLAAPSQVDVTEGALPSSFDLSLTTQPSSNVTVAVTFGASPDITIPTTSFTFTPANWNVSQAVTVAAVDDIMVEGIEHVTVTNTASSTDLDFDGLTATVDVRVFDDESDSDSDGLSDLEETGLGTDPSNPDTDGDGINDGDEVHTTGTDPLLPDTDGDGVDDGVEVASGCMDALDEDSDDDGLLDGYEVDNGLDPCADADADHDGLTDAEELQSHVNTNPLDPDTDDDTLSDGYEFKQHGSRPDLADTDGDGLNDNLERPAGFGCPDVRDPDSDHDGLLDGEDSDACVPVDNSPIDTDGDGLSDDEELILGTDPGVADTDGDGIDDGDEVALGTNPLDEDTDADTIKDGDEVNTYGTDPLLADTDDDGLADPDEIFTHETDPVDPDTDGDLFSDGTEVDGGSDPNNGLSLPIGVNLRLGEGPLTLPTDPLPPLF